MIRTAVIAAIAVVLAGCTGDDQPVEREIGQRADLHDLSVEIAQYRRDVEPRSANLPGSRMDAALVQMCNAAVAPDDAADVFSSLAWTARDGDRSYDPTSTTFTQSPAPPLPQGTSLARGRCVEGWVVWDVPVEATIVSIAFKRDSADAATWSTS
jgi:DMSO/TMAO reductase YedYZ molybdopterin-dependent catalytic subunit